MVSSRSAQGRLGGTGTVPSVIIQVLFHFIPSLKGILWGQREREENQELFEIV
jgi:hypothetical protein